MKTFKGDVKEAAKTIGEDGTIKIRDKFGHYIELTEKLKSEIRYRYLNAVKACYWHCFEEGVLQPDSLLVLIDANNRALDYTEERLDDWKYIKDVTGSNFLVKLSSKTINIPCLGFLIKSLLFERVQKAYDIIVNYVDAHKKSILMLQEIIENDDLVGIIVEEIEDQIEEAEMAIKLKLEDAFPDITQAVNQRKAEYFVLRQQINYVESLDKNG